MRRKIAENVFHVGVNDWDKKFFDNLIPLPDGTSYNAFLVRGTKKTALIDTVEPSKSRYLFLNLEGVEKIDYIISNHAEQDHSGTIPGILKANPGATVICSPKAKGLLVSHLQIEESFIRTVEDGEEISLGGKTLRFVHTPWAHWPETMSTYIIEDRILFSCDLFGSHMAGTNLFAGKDPGILDAAKRYFAEIMLPFRRPLRKNISKVKELDPILIAPSHGPAFDIPSLILDAYDKWTDDKPGNNAIIVEITMHGSTTIMVDILTDALVKRGISVKRVPMDIPDIGRLAMALVDAGTIIAATPTVLTGPHPNIALAIMLGAALKPKARQVAIIGSYGWGTRVTEKLISLMDGLKMDVLEPVLCKGLPERSDAVALDNLAERIAAGHREAGIL